MKYITLLDYTHLDNGLFMRTFSEQLAKQKNHQSIIIHGSSDYEKRIKEQGYSEIKAKIRAVKELNRRIIALLADSGVAAISMNAYQKSLFTTGHDGLRVNADIIDQLPEHVHLVLSRLINQDNSFELLPVNEIIKTLLNNTDYQTVITFPITTAINITLKDLSDPIEQLNLIPSELLTVEFPLKIMPINHFHTPEDPNLLVAL